MNRERSDGKKSVVVWRQKKSWNLQTLLFPVLLRTGTVPYESDCWLVCSTNKHTCTKNPNIYFFLVLNDIIFDISVIYQWFTKDFIKKCSNWKKFKDFLRTFLSLSELRTFQGLGTKFKDFSPPVRTLAVQEKISFELFLI